MNILRVGIFQKLCLERLLKEEADGEDRYNNTKYGNEISCHETFESFQNKKRF